MNYSKAIFLINDEVRAVRCSYAPKSGVNVPVPLDEKPHFNRPEEWTTFKTFDQDLTVGDYVVVPSTTRWGVTVCRIAEVDIDLDLETGEDVRWIVGRVNLEDFKRLQAQEEQAVQAIKSAQKRKRRDELREAMLADMPEDQLKALPGYHDAGSKPGGEAS